MLPQIEQLISDLRSLSADAHCQHDQPMRVLVVEDDPIDATIMSHTLEKVGCLVDVVNNGRTAIDTIKSDPCKYCVMFLDIGLPLVDGITVLVETRKVTRAIHIVIVTGGNRLPEIPPDSYFAVIRKPLRDDVAVEIMEKTKRSRDVG